MEDDCDNVDSETEALLYSSIYHAPLDFEDDFEDFIVKNTENDQIEKQTMTTTLPRPSSSVSLTPVESKRSTTKSVRRKRAVNNNDSVIWLSSDDERSIVSLENTKSSSSSTSSFSSLDDDLFQSSSFTDLNLNIIPSSKRSLNVAASNANSPSSGSTCFPEVDLINCLEDLSVPQIQAVLPRDPDLWQICEEDLWNRSSRKSYDAVGRYYRKVRCKRCHEFGHSVKECTIVPVCFICGEKKHSGYGCPRRSCLLCFKYGHTTDMCHERYRKTLNVSCSRCSAYGHFEKHCPEIWRQFHCTTTEKTTKLKKHKTTFQQKSVQFCFNCGRAGHLGAECMRSTLHNGRLIPFHHSVQNYDMGRNLRRLEDPRLKKDDEEDFDISKIVVEKKPKKGKKGRKKNCMTDFTQLQFREFDVDRAKKRQCNGRANFDKLISTKKKRKLDRQMDDVSGNVAKYISKKQIKKNLREERSATKKLMKAEAVGRKRERAKCEQMKKAEENYAKRKRANEGIVEILKIRKRAKLSGDADIASRGKYSWDSPAIGVQSGWF